jgi:hypothetical protein
VPWFRPTTSDMNCLRNWVALPRGGTLMSSSIQGNCCRTIPRGSFSSASCCDAMQAEFKLGDTIVLDRANGAGMTVRYRLPRIT